jgi:glycosyltransferase involved in cell wall biosynthesis
MEKKNKVSHQPEFKILMIEDAGPPFMGGGQVHVASLSAHLKKDFGCQVYLQYPKYSNIVYRAFWTFGAIPKLLVLAKTRSINLIHSHGYHSALAGKIVSKILSLPQVHTVHGANLIEQNQKGLKANLENWLLTKIAYSTEISVTRSFLKVANVNTPNFIPNGVDVDKFDAVNETKSTHPTIIWVGRITPVKNLSILKKSVNEVKKQIPKLELNIVSDGKLTGNALIKAYKEAWAFVLPSKSEGMPLTILEAWAAKLPVVATKVGDNPLLIQDDINGYLVDVDDAKALANKISLLITYPKKANKMGLTGYKLVRSTYTWGQVAKQTFKIYKNLVK